MSCNVTMGGCGDRKTPQESAQLTKQLTHSAGMCRHLARSVAETSACVKSHLLKWRQPEMKPKRERRHNVGPRADTQRQNYAHIYPVFRIHMALRGAQMLQFSLRTSPPSLFTLKSQTSAGKVHRHMRDFCSEHSSPLRRHSLGIRSVRQVLSAL